MEPPKEVASSPVQDPSEKETQWTDDRIRWQEDFAKQDKKKDEKEEEEEEEEECAFIDPFKDPDPFHTFEFQFDVASDEEKPIEIELRGYKTDSDQVWQSTGLTIWKASEHLCKYMAAHPDLFRGKQVLELGAGLGLCGILAHRLGGKTVCITDGDTDALIHLRDNLCRNKASGHDTRVVSAHQLIWGHETSKVFQKRHGTFEVLLASDIIYAKCIVEPLWETVRLLLSRSEDAKFIMAYYARRDVNVTIEFVLSYAEGAGFSYELVEEDPEGVHVFVFRWKSDEIGDF